MNAYSTREVGTAAGVSAELLDYWHRVALVQHDGRGSYDARSTSLAIVLGEASRLGAASTDLAVVASVLAAPVDEWPDSLWITARGDVLVNDSAPAAIVIHPRRVLARAGLSLLAALKRSPVAAA